MNQLNIAQFYNDLAAKAELPDEIFPEDILSLNPINEGVIVLRAPASEKSDGGIYYPDSAKQQMHLGWIVRAGPAAHLPLGIEQVDIIGLPVMWGRWMGGGIPVYPHEADFQCRFVFMQSAKEFWCFWDGEIR